MTFPVAYDFAGQSMCPGCALHNTNAGMEMAGLKPAVSMEECIASIVLFQIDNGLPIDTPYATMRPTKSSCDGCGREFKVHAGAAEEQP